MSWLSKAVKKIGKFFKKLGHQLKVNLKHGAKYIVPVLMSAMTGGFGGGIVQSLFGGNAAGMLKGLGNKVFTKLGLKGLAPQLTNNTASKAIGSSIDAASPDIINGANAALNAAGAPQLAGLGSSTAFGGALNTALSNALPQTAAKFGTFGASELVGSELGQLGEKLIKNNLFNAAGKGIDKLYAKEEEGSSSGGIGDISLKLPDFGKGQKPSTAVFDPSAAKNGNIFTGRSHNLQDSQAGEAMNPETFRAALASELGHEPTEEELEEMKKKGLMS